MSVQIMKQNDHVSTYIVDYVADTEDDVPTLPTSAYPGSSCLVIDSGNIYMLNNQKEWKIFGGNASGGGSSSGGSGSGGTGGSGSGTIPASSWESFS